MVTPRVGRSGTVTITPNGWLCWHPDPQRDPEPLPPEWVLRGLQEANLDDDASIMVLLAERGMVWGGIERTQDEATTPPGTRMPLPPVDSTFGVINHIAVIREQLVTLRGLARQWLDIALTGPDVPAPEPFWQLLSKGLAPFTPVTIARDPTPLVDLYEAGCWQLYEVIVEDGTPRRCAACPTVFYRKDGVSTRTADVLYCSERCRGRMRMRRYRDRSRARIPS